MKRFFLITATVATVALPVSFVAVGFSSPAFASSGVACAKLAGTVTGKFTISKCTPKNKKNKTASGSSTALASGGGTITWKPSKGTTTLNVTFGEASSNACTGGATQYNVSGSVTGGTSTYTANGDAVSAEACVNGNKITLVPGTKMDL